MSAGFGPVLLAIVSVLLIIGGVLLTWRDMRTKRVGVAAPDASPRSLPTTAPLQRAPAPAREERAAPPRPRVAEPTPRPSARPADDPAGYLDAEAAAVTIIKRETTQRGAPVHAGVATSLPARTTLVAAASQSSWVAPSAAPSAFTELTTSVAAILAETVDTLDHGADGQRWPSVEARWVHIEREIDRAVSTLKQALAGVALDIGPAGEVGWSFKNRGFGSYRRIAIGGRSVGWLRAETNQEHMLICKVRAHATDHALLNCNAEVPATRLDDVQLLDVLARVLKPSASYAAWLVPKDRTGPANTASHNKTSATDASSWAAIVPIAKDAFEVAAGALSEADAELIEVAAFALDPTTQTPRWRLAVSVGPERVADMVIDLSQSALDISANPMDRQRPDLARRRRLDLDGLDAHGFAEAIASCAWPAVANTIEQAELGVQRA